MTKSLQFRKDSRSTNKPVITAKNMKLAGSQIKYAFFTENVSNINLSFTSIHFIDVGIMILKADANNRDTMSNIYLRLNDCICEMKRIYYPSDKEIEAFIHNRADNISIFIDKSWFSHYSRDIEDAHASITSFGTINYVEIKNTKFYGSLIFIQAKLTKTVIAVIDVTVIDSKKTSISCLSACANLEITDSSFFNSSGFSVLYYRHGSISRFPHLVIKNSLFSGITGNYILNLGNTRFILSGLVMKRNSLGSSTMVLNGNSHGLVENLTYSENKGGYEVFSGSSDAVLNITESIFFNNEIETVAMTSGGKLHLSNVVVNDNKILLYGGIDHPTALFESKNNGLLTMENVVINRTRNSWSRKSDLIKVFEATIILKNVILSDSMVNTAIESHWSNIYLTNVFIENNEAYGNPSALKIYSSALRRVRNISLKNVTVIGKETMSHRKEPSQVVEVIDSTENFFYKDVKLYLSKGQTSYVGAAIKENVNFATYMNVICPAGFIYVFNNSVKRYDYPKIQYQMNCVMCVDTINLGNHGNFCTSLNSNIVLLIFVLVFNRQFC